MARTISEEEIKDRRVRLGRGFSHPWEEWLREDLMPVELIAGQDFTCKPESLRQQLSRRARELGFPGASMIWLDYEDSGAYAVYPTGPKGEPEEAGQ